MDGRAAGARAVRALVLTAALLGGAAGPAGAQSAERGSAEGRAFARALQMEREGRLGEAREALREVLRQDPAYAPALHALLRVAASLAEPASALPEIERAVASARGSDPAVRQAWVRGLAAAGLADSAAAVARRWADSTGDPTAWVELASVRRRAGRRDEAIEALRQGRAAAGEPSLFAQELAELHLEAGDPAAAAGEWVIVLGWGKAGVSAVAGRVRVAGTAGQAALSELWSRLLDPDSPVAAARGGLDLALALGDPDRAHTLLAALAGRLPADSRIPLLREVALEARRRGWSALAGWSAERLATETTDPAERRGWRALAAERTLEEGDTAAARSALEQVLRDSPPGSDAHRTAARRLFAVQAAADPGRAERLLAEYREAYGAGAGEKEVARMAVELARSHVRRGDLKGAERALGLLADPRDAQAAALVEGERARVWLYRGRPGPARAGLESAAFIPSGSPSERTEAVALLDALTRADSAEAAAFGRLLYDLVRGSSAPEAYARLSESWEAVPVSPSRPGLLALAAGALEEAGAAEESARLRVALVERFPGSAETPAALLSLARWSAAANPGEARAWLERLIVEHPASALTPIARRLLAEIGGQVPSS